MPAKTAKSKRGRTLLAALFLGDNNNRTGVTDADENHTTFNVNSQVATEVESTDRIRKSGFPARRSLQESRESAVQVGLERPTYDR
jgi:hypothetical protein